MPACPVYLDVTELVNFPLRTGIQRVERELIRYWPGPAQLTLCAFDRNLGDLVTLPRQAASILISSSNGSRLGVDEERAAMHSLVSSKPAFRLPDDQGSILNAELFFDPSRAEYYRQVARAGRRHVRWLVYDFLPYLQPGWFSQGTGRSVMPYLRTLRAVPHVAFISERTRQDYLRRVMRSGNRDGPVISLGGDGIGLVRQTFTGERDGYVVLGSVEPRKRVAAVIEAFQILWAQGSQARLTVIGRVLPHATQEVALMASLKANPLFRHLADASDNGIQDELGHARAMIFASEGEGFGLPPFEGLYCGLPVIVGPNVPSIEMLPVDGQIRLSRITPDQIAGAVESMQDDIFAERLWTEAARLQIPTWRDFAVQLAQWEQTS